MKAHLTDLNSVTTILFINAKKIKKTNFSIKFAKVQSDLEVIICKLNTLKLNTDLLSLNRIQKAKIYINSNNKTVLNCE